MKDPVKGTHLLSSTLHQCFSPLKKIHLKAAIRKSWGRGAGRRRRWYNLRATRPTMALLLVLEMPLESCTLLSTKYNLCYLQHVLGTDYSHSAEGEKNNPGEQEVIKKKKKKESSAKQLKASTVCWTKIQIKNLKFSMFVHKCIENHTLLSTSCTEPKHGLHRRAAQDKSAMEMQLNHDLWLPASLVRNITIEMQEVLF